jgi:hypothetical protein
MFWGFHGGDFSDSRILFIYNLQIDVVGSSENMASNGGVIKN